MRKALVVGIGNYAEDKMLSCINDAEAVHKLLKENGNGRKNFISTLCKDVKTRSDLKNYIARLFSSKCELALFYFSGHGYRDKYGLQLVTLYGLPSDAGVSITELMTIVNNSPAKNKIVILDCCYAGLAGRGWSTTSKLKDAVYLEDGVTMLTSCSKKEEAIAIGGHSVFTNLLIQALEGGSADLNGNITPGSIYAFIDKALGPNQQRPEFKTNISSFVSLRKVVPPIQASILKNLTDYFDNPTDKYELDPSFEPTNHPSVKHPLYEPYRKKENTAIFKQLQAMQGVGLVKPVGEKHMYYAAMKSKSCELTPLGQHYWRLAKKGRIQ